MEPFSERLGSFWNDFVTRTSSHRQSEEVETVVLVSHGAAISALMNQVLVPGRYCIVPPEVVPSRFWNCSITELLVPTITTSPSAVKPGDMERKKIGPSDRYISAYRVRSFSSTTNCNSSTSPPQRWIGKHAKSWTRWSQRRRQSSNAIQRAKAARGGYDQGARWEHRRERYRLRQRDWCCAAVVERGPSQRVGGT